MKMRRKSGIAPVTLLLFLVFGLPLVAQESAERSPLKIGVVDMNSVFEVYKKRGEYKKLLEEFQQQKLQEIQSKREELKRVYDKIQLLAPDSPERKKEEENLSRINIEIETGEKLADREIDEKYRKFLIEIYSDINEAVRLYGQENNFDLILKSDVLDTNVRSTILLELQLTSHKVLYFSPALDLTDAIVKRLNDKDK